MKRFAVLLCMGILISSVGWGQDVPYETGFEAAENFLAGDYSVGLIPNENNWEVESGTASIQAATVSSGAQALQVQPQSLVNLPRTGVTENTLWMQGYYRARPQNEDPSVVGPSSVLLYFNETEGLRVYDGNDDGQGAQIGWKSVGVPVMENSWYLITVFLNFSEQKWDLYVNSSIIEQGIGFQSTEVTQFNGFRMRSSTNSSGYLDDFYVSSLKPDNIPDPPTPTPTPTSSSTATPTATSTVTHTPTNTYTSTPTSTATMTPTSTDTYTPTATATSTITPTPSSTPLPPQAFLVFQSGQEGPPPFEALLQGYGQQQESPIVQYGWSFFDAEVRDATIEVAATETIMDTTSFNYVDPGFYEVAFWVWDENGSAASATEEIVVWTQTPTHTATVTPTFTHTPTATPTYTLRPTDIPTSTPTSTTPPTATSTETPVPVNTATATATATGTTPPSQTPTTTPTETETALPSSTATATPTLTETPVETETPTPSETPGETETPTPTATQQQQQTPSPTPTGMSGLEGDVNNDGWVNGNDFFYFSAGWFRQYGEYPLHNLDIPGATDTDQISEEELLILIKSWKANQNR